MNAKRLEMFSFRSAMTVQRELAINLLETIADDFESNRNADSPNNPGLTRFAGNVTLLLGCKSLTARFVQLLNRSNWNDFFDGIISNIELPRSVPERFRQLSPVEEFEKEHPLFTETYAIDTFDQYFPEMVPCLEQGFDQLLAEASTDSRLEEIALSQALLGHYDNGFQTSAMISDPIRKNNVLFCIAIEQYRLEHIEEANNIRQMLAGDSLKGWNAAHFALGICNRVPWCVYPYSDY